MAVYKEINGKSVCLKPAAIDDAQYTYDIRQDQKRTKYMHHVGGNVEDQKNWITNQRQRKGDYFFVVHDKNNIPLGTVSVYNVIPEDAMGEVGRVILNGNPMQNMEALVLIHEFAFLALGLEVLKSGILSKNTASIGVTLRMGGIENHRVYQSDFQDELIWYDIHKKDYIERRKQFLALIERFGNRKAVEHE